MALPMRFRILRLIYENEALTDTEVVEELKAECGNEGQHKESAIRLHLLAMTAVGLIEVADISLDERGRLREVYKITDHGLGRIKYLPKGQKKSYC